MTTSRSRKGLARRHSARGAVATAMVLTSLSLIVCSSVASAGASASRSTSGAHRAAAQHGGTADVAFAGSLLAVDNELVGPGFERATGYAYTGRGGGSIGLAHDISAGEISPGVFE